MSATDLAALVVAIASVVAVMLLLYGLVSFTRTLRALRQSVDELRAETLPVVTELQQTVRQANADLERIDTLLITAESVSGTVDSASRLAYLALSNPVIKAIAFGAGTSRAVKRLRRGS